MNKCHFSGNLTRDPELKFTPSGTAVLNFTIAVSRRYKKGEEMQTETAFIDAVAWDSGAEAIGKFFKKGDSIIAHGSMQQENWETDGQKRSKLKLRVEEFEFPPNGNKKSGDSSTQQDAPQEKEKPKSSGKSSTKKPSTPPPEDNDAPGDDEVPF